MHALKKAAAAFILSLAFLCSSPTSINATSNAPLQKGSANGDLKNSAIPSPVATPKQAKKPCAEFKTARYFSSNIYFVKANLSQCKLDLLFGSDKNFNRTARLSTMVSNYEKKNRGNVLAAINGSFFDYVERHPVGEMVYSHKGLIKSVMRRSSIAYDGKTLRFGYFYTDPQISKYDFIVTGGPRLLKEGRNVAIESGGIERFSSGYYGKHPRTAVGQTKDGFAIFMIADGRTKSSAGLSLWETGEVMKKAGAFNAINFDGGGSSELILSGEFYGRDPKLNFIENHPSDAAERQITNGIAMVEDMKLYNNLPLPQMP